MASRLPHPQSQRHQGPSLAEVLRPEATSGPRVVIRYQRLTTSPLDAENFAGSTKALTDLITEIFPESLPDDSPEYVEIIHTQVRVQTKAQEGTAIVIEFP